MEDDKKTLIEQCVRTISDLKDREAELRQRRQKAEEWLMRNTGIDPQNPKMQTYESDKVKVSFSKNIDTKVNYDKLLEIRAQNKDLDYTSLFRFKAEVNSKAFKETTDDVRLILAPAITTKVNKPTIEITYKEG